MHRRKIASVHARLNVGWLTRASAKQHHRPTGLGYVGGHAQPGFEKAAITIGGRVELSAPQDVHIQRHYCLGRAWEPPAHTRLAGPAGPADDEQRQQPKGLRMPTYRAHCQRAVRVDYFVWTVFAALRAN